MDYQEFLTKVRKDLEEAFPDTEIIPRKVERMYGPSYEGLAIRMKGSDIGPVLKLEEEYHLYEKGSDYKHLLGGIKVEASELLEASPRITRDMIMDYSHIKDRLAVEFLNNSYGGDHLDEVPHYDMEDLKAVYRIILNEGEEGRMSIMVTNGMMDAYQVTPEQLHQQAVENMERDHPLSIRSLDEVIYGMCGMSVTESQGKMDLYVATTSDYIFGASVITHPDFMEKAAEKLQGDFYILPSSVHEVLLAKDHGKAVCKDLEEMVRDVNRAQVPPHERLSDHVYHYDSSAKVFELAEKYEDRKFSQEKKFSVREELDQKGKQVEQKKHEQPKQDKDTHNRHQDNHSL